MRVWKLEACSDDERICGRWGYALAETADDALVLAQSSSALPHIWVHEQNSEMVWPGASDEPVFWTS